jgi:hypothetical protein
LGFNWLNRFQALTTQVVLSIFYNYYQLLYVMPTFPGTLLAVFLHLLDGSSHRVPGREMTIPVKIIIILIFLVLLLGTDSGLAFLAPLPLAHALSVWRTK